MSCSLRMTIIKCECENNSSFLLHTLSFFTPFPMLIYTIFFFWYLIFYAHVLPSTTLQINHSLEQLWNQIFSAFEFIIIVLQIRILRLPSQIKTKVVKLLRDFIFVRISFDKCLNIADSLSVVTTYL